MNPKLLDIYGPISIQSYGALIALGVVVSLGLIAKDYRYKKLNLQNKLLDIIAVAILAGFAGGRILFILTEYQQYDSIFEMMLPWTGGLSVLGSIIGILIALPLYLKKLNVPIFPFLDLISIYAPLTQSFGRIGCFFAGCCYGLPTTFPWGVVYTHADCFAPLGQTVHPAQLYSAIILLCIFALMFFVVQKKLHITGQLVCAYLFFSSVERFFVDFFRGDRSGIIETPFAALSHTQLIAFTITIASVIAFCVITRKNAQNIQVHTQQ